MIARQRAWPASLQPEAPTAATSSTGIPWESLRSREGNGLSWPEMWLSVPQTNKQQYQIACEMIEDQLHAQVGC